MYSMNILFIDRNYPGPFEYIATELAKNSDNSVTFITNTAGKKIDGVNAIIYDVTKVASESGYPLASFLEEAALQGEFAANSALALQKSGFKPDVIIGSATGASMFIKDIFTDVTYICYFEKFNRAEDYAFVNQNEGLTEEQKMVIKCQNSNILIDLYTSDAGITPTEWQKNQFPIEFHDKIKIIINDENTLSQYLDYISSLIGEKE